MFFAIQLIFASYYSRCVELYGSSPFIQHYDSIHPLINVKYVQCGRRRSLAVGAISQMLRPTSFENSILEQRLTHFVTGGIVNHTISVKNDTNTFINLTTTELGDAQYSYSSGLIPNTNVSSFVYKFDKKFIVVSDIDDTVKFLNVTFKMVAIRNLLLVPQLPFYDIKSLYSKWQHNASFVYLSAGFKQTYPFVKPFIKSHFPPGPVLLRSLTLKNALIYSQVHTFEYKLKTASTILNTTSQMVVLVGDSTEVDPNVYAAVYTAFPTRIKYIFIRLVEPWQLNATVSALKDVPSYISRIFTDASTLPQQLV